MRPPPLEVVCTIGLITVALVAVVGLTVCAIREVTPPTALNTVASAAVGAVAVALTLARQGRNGGGNNHPPESK